MTVGYGAYLEKKSRKEERNETIKEISENTEVRMLKDGKLSDDDISRYANISVDEVRHIKASMKL